MKKTKQNKKIMALADPSKSSNGYFYVSIWLGHGVPRHLAKYYSGCIV